MMDAQKKFDLILWIFLGIVVVFLCLTGVAMLILPILLHALFPIVLISLSVCILLSLSVNERISSEKNTV